MPRIDISGYFNALVALGLATALHLALLHTTGVTPAATTFIYVLALLVSAWRGFGPGYLTLALGIAVVPYLYRPNFSPADTDPYVLLMLAAVSSATSWIAGVRHRIESSLRTANEEANATLRRQLAELESLYTKLPVGLCLLDKELRFLRINERLSAIHGQSVSAHIGRKHSEIVASAVGTVLESIFVDVLNSGTPVVDRELRGRMMDSDTEDRDWMVSCSRVDTDDGIVVGLQVVVQEITLMKRAERAFLRANEELKQFTYLAAHDLQEPLRTIVNFSELAQRRSEGALPPEAAAHLARVVGAAKRMGNLISDVLAYARAAVDAEGTLLTVDLDLILTSTLESVAHLIEENRAVIQREPLPSVAGDSARLSQVFQNLIVNAIKYRKDDEPPRVHVTAERRGDMWLIAVQDNGQGFREEYAERIFGMFKRLHGSSIPGSGIGLAICKAIIERHGGQIWAQSAPGRGATFYFTLHSASQSAESLRKTA